MVTSLVTDHTYIAESCRGNTMLQSQVCETEKIWKKVIFSLHISRCREWYSCHGNHLLQCSGMSISSYNRGIGPMDSNSALVILVVSLFLRPRDVLLCDSLVEYRKNVGNTIQMSDYYTQLWLCIHHMLPCAQRSRYFTIEWEYSEWITFGLRTLILSITVGSSGGRKVIKC